MTISTEKKPLVSSLIPQTIINDLEKLNDETAICAITLLIVNTALGALDVLKKGNFKKLDANPGDGGCQNRACELKRLMKMDFKADSSNLEQMACKIKEMVKKRRGNSKERAKCAANTFFQEHVTPLTISKEMEYILHCYLSTVLRTPYRTHPNGVVMTRSEVNKLSLLSDKITVLDNHQRKMIVEENQKTLSRLSVSAMHFAATQVSSLELKEKELMTTMLSPQQTHLFNHDSKYGSKAFGCLFYEVKTLLVNLREEQGIVCLKSIVAQGQPFYILLQSKTSGNEFEILPDEAFSSLSPLTSVICFEAVVNVNKEKTSQVIKEYGFTNIILAQAAKQPPYEPTSSLEEIKIPEALEEISIYKEKGLKMGEFITVDHVYLNTLAAEIKNKDVPEKKLSSLGSIYTHSA